MMAPFILLLPLVAALPPPVDLDSEPAPSTSTISQPVGRFDAADVDKAGAAVVALCGDTLVATTVRVRKTDQDGELVAEPISCPTATFFVAGARVLTPGKVKLARVVMNEGQQVPRDGSVMALAAGKLRRTVVGAGFVVTWENKQRVQTLLKTTNDDDGGVNVIAVGDFNRDGHDDIVMTASRKYSASYLRLFLSDADGVLHQQAVGRPTGC